MAAFGMMHSNRSSYCTMAAAGTSAPMIPILDTAIILAVSICVVCLRLVHISQAA